MIDDPDPKVARLLTLPETTCCPTCGALAEIVERWTETNVAGGPPAEHWNLRCSDPDARPRHLYQGPVAR